MNGATMRGVFAATVCGAVALAAGPALGKTISITIGQKAEIQNGNLAVHLNIGNTGDEAAKSVAPSLRFGEKQVRGTLRPELVPNGSFEEDLQVPTGELGEGRWPFQIAVDYADANQYPFQALLVTTLVVGNPPPGKVSVPEIASSGISDSGTLNVRFKNLAGVERDTSYRVVVPEGLEATTPTGTVHLPAWGENTANVSVVNRTALAGSRYPVFVTIEYEDGGLHQGVVAQGVVEIFSAQSFWQRNTLPLLAVAGLLVAVWLVLVVRSGAFSRRT
jgi:hypothetical protein